MPKHRKSVSDRHRLLPIAPLMTTGAAIVGAGVMLMTPPGTPGAISVPAPEAPATTSAPVDLAALSLPIIGDVGTALGDIVGIFIGNGASADPTTCTAPCNGENAGLLLGNGGNGALGGNGGRGGLLFGNGGGGGGGAFVSGVLYAGGNGGSAGLIGDGGSAGDGVDALYNSTTGARIHAASDGGTGGNGGLLFGNGAQGGLGGWDTNPGSPEERVTPAAPMAVPAAEAVSSGATAAAAPRAALPRPPRGTQSAAPAAPAAEQDSSVTAVTPAPAVAP